jgi:hypothetical protein
MLARLVPGSKHQLHGIFLPLKDNTSGHWSWVPPSCSCRVKEGPWTSYGLVLILVLYQWVGHSAASFQVTDHAGPLGHNMAFSTRRSSVEITGLGSGSAATASSNFLIPLSKSSSEIAARVESARTPTLRA